MTSSNELSCIELVELVTAYLERALSPRDRVRFEEHLAICQGCRNYLDQMQQTITLVGKLAVESVPVGAREQLLQAFRNWKSS
jgi:predicted anti-sigma-YlaC factor YlaD